MRDLTGATCANLVAIWMVLASCGNEVTESEREVSVEAGLPVQAEAIPEVVSLAESESTPLPPEVFRQLPPEGWVDLIDELDGVRFDIRYHTSNNFTGAPLPGYGVPGAWLRSEPAQALARVQADLAAKGLGLLVYDAYRPLRGTLAMVAWAERTHQVALLDNGYIARRSGHNRGNTVDLTLVDLTTGVVLDMGTPWDTLDERSHTRNETGDALEHRLVLQTAMRAHGWEPYWKEWWHFSFPMNGPLPHRDVPYSCFEPDEGAWGAPEGWNKPGYAMSVDLAMPDSPCPEEANQPIK